MTVHIIYDIIEPREELNYSAHKRGHFRAQACVRIVPNDSAHNRYLKQSM